MAGGICNTTEKVNGDRRIDILGIGNGSLTLAKGSYFFLFDEPKHSKMNNIVFPMSATVSNAFVISSRASLRDLDSGGDLRDLLSLDSGGGVRELLSLDFGGGV